MNTLYKIYLSISPFYKIYLSIIVIALLLSYILYKKGIKSSLLLFFILLATLLVELIAVVAGYYKLKGYTFVYHIFNLIEYVLFCLYYLKVCQTDRFKKLVKILIPVYIMFCLCISVFHYHFDGLPAINIDAEGFLLFIIYTHLLFSLEVNEHRLIFAHPDFWISTGILIFFGGVFVSFGVYPALLNINPTKAMGMFEKTTEPLNLILYICIIISFICLLKTKRYSIQ